MQPKINVQSRTAPVLPRTGTFDWGDVRFFLELCQHRTLSGAARALRVSHVTVARRLTNLEKSLALTLFKRQADGYELTRDGTTVLTHAKSMNDAVSSIMEYKRNKPNQPRHVVRITATRTLADVWLTQQLERLRQNRPDIALDILTTSRNLSLARGEADIALRLARPPEGDMVVRKVASLGYAFYAAATYAKDASERNVRFIQFEHGSSVPEAIWLEAFAAERPTVLRSNSQLAQKAAAIAGLGVALLPRYLGEWDPRLIAQSLSASLPDREVWIITTRRASRLPHVRAVINELVAAFARDKYFFSGSLIADQRPHSIHQIRHE